MNALSLTSRRGALLGAAAAAVARPRRARADLMPVKLTLDFRRYGGNAPFLLAQDLGFFADEGIDPQIDGASGSGDAITRVASAAYDFGFADPGTLVEFSARNPQAGPKMIMTILDRPPHSLISYKNAGITTLADLKGRKLGVGTADAGSRLLPAILRLNNVDITAVDRQLVTVQLRETMLIRRAVDAVAGFDYTVVFNLIGNDVQPSELNIMGFADYGLDFWGNGLIASRGVIARDPGLVRRIARACARGWMAASHDPAAAVQSLVKRDPLTPVANETARMTYVIKTSLLTQRVRAAGFGEFDPKRAEAGLKMLAEGFELPRVPSADEIYDDRFLPPISDRSGFAA